MKHLTLLFVVGGITLLVATNAPADDIEPLKSALTFHASFDGKTEADFAKGDPKLYTVLATKPEVKTQEGLPESVENVAHESGGGKFGDFLQFKTNKNGKIFFKARDNFHYSEKDWEGSFSVWMRTTPDEDIPTGYTDPIQITPRSALDACFFCEFGIEEPRPFRLGVFPDKAAWNPDNIPGKDFPLTSRPLISVVDPPFSRDRWTHVAFTFRGFNKDDTNAVTRIFVDGIPRGDLMNWKQQFTWDLEEAQIRLGVKFVGGMDEISCFKRALTIDEVKTLFELEKGVTGILGK